MYVLRVLISTPRISRHESTSCTNPPIHDICLYKFIYGICAEYCHFINYWLRVLPITFRYLISFMCRLVDSNILVVC